MVSHPDILVVAGAEGHDEELVAAAAAHRPRRVTVLIEGDDARWEWGETPAARTRRDRLALLLAAVERATGAAVVGLVGDPRAGVDGLLGRFDAIVGGRGLPSTA